MPIVTLQRQFRELGRIRLGEKGPKGQPMRLGTWRLTSPDRKLLEAAAAEYQGEVVAWPDAPDGDEFQLITAVDELDILVPPGRPMSQWNELWSGAGCQRRCDGEREWLRNVPCLCPTDPEERNALASKGEACKPTTRLSVILPKLPDLGTWMYVSHGYYAAVELAGTADLLAAAATGGRMLKASLYIDQRTVKRPGQQTRKFPVPAIRIHETMTQLLAGGNGAAPLLEGATGRVPAQLTTSAPLPADPSFTQRPADAPICRHPDDKHQVDERGVFCSECSTRLAARDTPAAEEGMTSAPATARTASSPPGGSSVPAPATLPEATARVGALALQHRLVTALDTDEHWDAFDDVLRTRGMEPPPLEERPEAIAEWNALGDRIAGGEFDAATGDDPAGKCQAHQLPWKFVPAGTNRAGKAFRSFWTCPERDCSAKPTKAWRDTQPQKAGEEVPA